MKLVDTRFRDAAMVAALEEALAGQPTALFDKLRRNSGLPGPRHAVSIIRALAGELGARGAAADALIERLLDFDDRRAPYGNVDEFLAIGGVASLVERALLDAHARGRLLDRLATFASDPRLRVRGEVASGLARVAVAVHETGEDMRALLLAWMQAEDPWQPVMVLEALTQREVLAVVPTEVLGELLDVALERLGEERRAARRSEAFQRFSKSLGALPVAWMTKHPTLVAVAVKYAVPMADEDVRLTLEVLLVGLQKAGARVAAAPLEEALRQSKKRARDPRYERIARGRGQLR